MIRVGIIGAGLVGAKRADSLSDARLVAVQDKDHSRAKVLAEKHRATVEKDWRDLIARDDIEVVVVSTSHDMLSECSQAALSAGKHVLVEKPGGRNIEEIQRQINASEKFKKILRVGYNHRFHPALQKAKEIVEGHSLGDLMFVRARYGHGGRLGYEKEWRADPSVSGGGELLDQGVHLIDLAQWMMGPLNPRWGTTHTFFWPMKVEDYGFVALESEDHQRCAWLHASWVEWKNIFHFEIFCQRGKLEISGLGGSYGVEELRVFKMKPEMGPPETEVFSFPGSDLSWKLEWESFVRSLQGSPQQIGTTGLEARKNMEIVRWVYERNGQIKS
ncbi:MAG: Inositol 2-dehydrogenase/D-chiro-inositol 3-dehydrogenase [Elusimicrobia bacterium]|nr:Inositol 2-dehydrogenase/D-chiro-inositol 3-dehydrogenase [Elusimicrobiota bacterium]